MLVVVPDPVVATRPVTMERVAVTWLSGAEPTLLISKDREFLAPITRNLSSKLTSTKLRPARNAVKFS